MKLTEPKFRVARAYGDNNLLEALNQLDADGYHAVHVVFCGMIEVRNKLMPNAPGQQAPVFTIVGKIKST